MVPMWGSFLYGAGAWGIDVNAGEQGHQVADLDVLEGVDRVLDLVREVAVDAIGGELVELFDLVVPGERARRHPRIVLHLVLERRAVLQLHGDLRGHEARVLRGVGGVRPCGHFREQRLDVRAVDAVVGELSWHDVPVQQRHGQQVSQVVVRLFLRGHGRLRAVQPAAGEVVGDLRHLGADRDDRFRVEPGGDIQARMVRGRELDHAVDRRLRVDLGVVLLDRAGDDALVALGVPVDAQGPVEQVVEAEGSLDDAQRPLDSAAGQEQRVHRAERGLRRRESLPLRQRLGPDDRERGIAGGGHRDRVRDLRLGHAEQPPGRGVVREGELRRVIEAAGHEVAVVDQARLDGVTERHAEHQVAAAAAGQLRGGQRDAEVVRRVARLGRREEVVHEVHVTDEHGVPERRVDGIGLAAADQRHPVTTAEVADLVAAGADRAGSEGRDGARQAVQDMDRKLRPRLGRQVVERGPRRVAGERLHLRLMVGRGDAWRGRRRGIGLLVSRCHERPPVVRWGSGCQVKAMNAARVRSEPTLLNSTTEAISRCPCRYSTAKITAAAGAGSALARTSRRRSVCAMPIAAKITHSSAGATTFRAATVPTTKRLTVMRCANSTMPVANNATPVVADPRSFIALTSTSGSWTPARTSTSARTGAHTTGAVSAERTCCPRPPEAAAGAAGGGPTADAGAACACIAVTVCPAPPAAKAGLSSSAGRRPGCCVTGAATRGAVALAAADPAAADSSTSVTGTSMTFSTSAPTATGTALKDGPYK